MDKNFRCDCPFTSALDVLGDKWILVIIKQILIENKRTFKDFTESEEAIASNILSSKLKQLEHAGIISKTKLPDNKKSNYYMLTEKGIDLIPVIVELGVWGDRHLRGDNPSMVDGKGMKLMRKDKEDFSKKIEQNYREKLEEFHSTLSQTSSGKS